MTAFTYTAERELTAGHSQGTSYTVGVPCSDIQRIKDLGKEQSRSMSGAAVETIVFRNKRAWRIVTGILQGGALEAANEFLESVVEGETFTFDEYGQPGQPANPISVKLNGEFDRARALRQGDGGAADGFRFSFEIFEL